MTGRLTISDLAVSYGPRRVLDGVSLTLAPGELCALLGLNGSGKSTLLRAVCGLIPCETAELAVDGVSLLGMHEGARARLLCYVPQRSGVASGLTVADMLLMGYNPHLGLLDRPSRTQRERAWDQLAQVGLPGCEGRMLDELSEGQRQLVVLARALVQDAPVMLLDEPDSALDFLNRHQLLETVSRTVRGAGKGGLITLHDPNFAMAYCDRLLLLKDGALVGNVAMAAAAPAQLEDALGKLYGPVAISECSGQRFLTRKGGACAP